MNTTLHRASTPNTDLESALTVFLTFIGAQDSQHSVDNPIAFVSSEVKFSVGAIAKLDPQSIADAFEAECFSPSVGLRWVATSESKPFTGTATLISESGVGFPASWQFESVPCTSHECAYACWGTFSKSMRRARWLVMMPDNSKSFMPGFGLKRLIV